MGRRTKEVAVRSAPPPRCPRPTARTKRRTVPGLVRWRGRAAWVALRLADGDKPCRPVLQLGTESLVEGDQASGIIPHVAVAILCQTWDWERAEPSAVHIRKIDGQGALNEVEVAQVHPSAPEN